jgi:two-component system copper resistance phosphate regulon response regulator CusR
MYKTNILLIEDDANLSLTINKTLAEEEIKLDVAYSGEDGLNKALTNKHNLILLDIGLPGMTGLEVLKRIRDIGNTVPVIIITSEGSVNTEIQAYNNGANFFHRKPINFELLLAQIRNLLPESELDYEVTMKDIVINTKERSIFKKGKKVNLTKSELDLVIMLTESNGSIFSRNKIIANLMNYNKDLENSAVDTMVCRIRKKISKYGDEEFIETVPKEGFRINLDYIHNPEVVYFK